MLPDSLSSMVLVVLSSSSERSLSPVLLYSSLTSLSQEFLLTKTMLILMSYHASSFSSLPMLSVLSSCASMVWVCLPSLFASCGMKKCSKNPLLLIVLLCSRNSLMKKKLKIEFHEKKSLFYFRKSITITTKIDKSDRLI